MNTLIRLCLVSALALFAAPTVTQAQDGVYLPKGQIDEVYAAWNAAWLDRNPGRTPPFIAPADGRIYFIGIETASELIRKSCKRVPGEPGQADMLNAARLLNAEYARKKYTTRVTPEENGKESLFLLIAQLSAGCPGVSAGDAAGYNRGYNDGLAAARAAVGALTNKP